MAFMVVFGLLLVVNLLCIVPTVSQTVNQPGIPNFCLEGPFHPERPVPESQDFDECLSWEEKACCTVDVPMIIDQHKAVGLYNYSWDVCETLSQECETFIKVSHKCLLRICVIAWIKYLLCTLSRGIVFIIDYSIILCSLEDKWAPT
jgi:uncharacterized protein YfcZ (UPF0381/DUF406 family)